MCLSSARVLFVTERVIKNDVFEEIMTQGRRVCVCE